MARTAQWALALVLLGMFANCALAAPVNGVITDDEATSGRSLLQDNSSGNGSGAEEVSTSGIPLVDALQSIQVPGISADASAGIEFAIGTAASVTTGPAVELSTSLTFMFNQIQAALGLPPVNNSTVTVVPGDVSIFVTEEVQLTTGLSTSLVGTASVDFADTLSSIQSVINGAINRNLRSAGRIGSLLNGGSK